MESQCTGILDGRSGTTSAQQRQKGGGVFASGKKKICYVLRVHPDFAGVWSQVDFNEGMLPFKELLNIATCPNGPQMCYPQGTDVRVPATPVSAPS